ncbi:MAG: acyl-ACP--UDP-N-acetylglucosamine O-acyltransferase [Deltaproteobacteria bacterium]|nr:acyl-ACP--UDP-N-acetylglucosamine O-acyltransferase [Candidatus Anaeroferrophillacea bacterium]
MTYIHPTAIVSVAARLAEDVRVGPYSVIEGDVEVGAATVIDHHATISGRTVIGPGCRIYPYALVGTDPQDMKYAGEETDLEIGAGTVIREYVTISRGTAHGGGITRVGRDNMLMAYCHVAHDCSLGDGVIMANGATLGGHIVIEECAIIGGLAAIHQFCHVGGYTMIAGTAGVSQDVPPYCMASGNHCRLYGLNSVGLRRHGFSRETLAALKRTYRLIYRTPGLPMAAALERVAVEVPDLPEVRRFTEFVQAAQRPGRRGVCRKG